MKVYQPLDHVQITENTYLNLGDGNPCQSSYQLNSRSKNYKTSTLTDFHLKHSFYSSVVGDIQSKCVHNVTSFYSLARDIQSECVHNVTFILFIS